MRNEFAKAVVENHGEIPNQVFLTGDLGYMSLEHVQEKFGKYFINAGIAEQNMVSVAAALAYEKFIPWVYSISPFCTLRPYEQIRVDVCLHNLPVKIVGNGGGYGYGIMGATHHNLEDIAVMRVLPNMKVYIPFFAEDVEECVKMILKDQHPNYLRLNQGAKIDTPHTPFAQWRKIKSGNKAVVIGAGPVLENICNLPSEIVEDLEIWHLGILPFAELPQELLQKIEQTQKIITIEEHYGQCGINEAISSALLQKNKNKLSLLPLYAKGYPSGKYGSQKWHQTESGLFGEQLLQSVTNFIL